MRGDPCLEPPTHGTLFFANRASGKDITGTFVGRRTIDETAVNAAVTKSRDGSELKCMRFTVSIRYSASVERTTPNYFSGKAIFRKGSAPKSGFSRLRKTTHQPKKIGAKR